MAAKQNNSKRKAQKAKPKRVPRGPSLQFNDAAIRYAKLLADPCNGDLVPGPFGDGTGGMVARFEREYAFGGDPTSTAAAFAFCPAFCNISVSAGAGNNDGSSFTWASNTDPLYPPGFTYLRDNAASLRPLSCCIQLSWVGKEFDRQGVVSLGRFPAEILGDTTTTSRLRTCSQYAERMPATMSEIVWRPQEQDLYFGNRTENAPLNSAGGVQNTVLVATVSSIPPGASIRLRLVVVYEWIPDPLSGLKVTTSLGGSKPTRLGDILAMLDRTGDWMAGTATAAARAISSIGAGVGNVMSLGRGAARIGTSLLGA